MRHFNKESRDYDFIDKYEAGLSLTGSDAKSLRVQTPQFANSKIEFVAGRPTLINFLIPAYKYAQGQIIDTTRSRDLLLTKKQIAKLTTLRHQKYMMVPIAIFPKGKWFKVEFGVGRKMRKYEKREKIKAKEISKILK